MSKCYNKEKIIPQAGEIIKSLKCLLCKPEGPSTHMQGQEQQLVACSLHADEGATEDPWGLLTLTDWLV